MTDIKVLVRDKKGYKLCTFRDLGNGKVRGMNGETFQMVVTRPDGGVLKGTDNVGFRFPQE